MGYAYKTRFWYLVGVFSKFSDEHPSNFYRVVTSPEGAYRRTKAGAKSSAVILLCS